MDENTIVVTEESGCGNKKKTLECTLNGTFIKYIYFINNWLWMIYILGMTIAYFEIVAIFLKNNNIVTV